MARMLRTATYAQGCSYGCCRYPKDRRPAKARDHRDARREIRCQLDAA